MNEAREYLDEQGRSPFARWFNSLNAEAAAKVATTVIRMTHGNFSNVKGVGSGVFENNLGSRRNASQPGVQSNRP